MTQFTLSDEHDNNLVGLYIFTYIDFYLYMSFSEVLKVISRVLKVMTLKTLKFLKTFVFQGNIVV